MTRQRRRGRPRGSEPLRMMNETMQTTAGLMVGAGGLILGAGVLGSLTGMLKK